MTHEQWQDLARWLCRNNGGNWDAKAHKRGHWRRVAIEFADTVEAQPAVRFRVSWGLMAVVSVASLVVVSGGVWLYHLLPEMLR